MGIFGRKVSPLPKEGMSIDLKSGYAVVASGRVTHVYKSDLIDVEITHSTTSFYTVGTVHRVDLRHMHWQLVREDSW